MTILWSGWHRKQNKGLNEEQSSDNVPGDNYDEDNAQECSTKNDISIMSEMNMAQIKVNPETGKVDTFDGNTTIMQNQEHGNTRNT